MSEAYQIIEKKETQRLAAFVAEHGQAFFPLVSLVEQSQLAVEDLMDVMGRAGVEAVLLLSAKGLTGEPHPGKRGGEVRRYGSQGGRVMLKGRKLKVRKPRLRRRGQGRGGGGAGVRGHAGRPRAGGADAGFADAGGLHAELRGRSSRVGRDGGGVEVGREPAEHRGGRGRAAASLRAAL